MSLLRGEGITLRYGDATVLDGVTVDIGPGEIVTLVGPNGSGKSSLVRVLCGMITPQAGRVTRKPGLSLGYVPQKLALDPSLPMSVARFMNLPRRTPAKAVADAMREAGIEGLADRQLHDLSGGQMQRALLARALLAAPDLLVLDEPTAGLDQPGEAAFYQRIEALRDKLGLAVFMVSHDLHVVMSASDRVICLNHHVCCEGTPHVVRDAPEYRALFGEGTKGALALYQHVHDHDHHGHAHGHDHAKDHDHA